MTHSPLTGAAKMLKRSRPHPRMEQLGHRRAASEEVALRSLSSWSATLVAALALTAASMTTATADAATPIAPAASSATSAKTVTVVLKAEQPRVLTRLAAHPVGDRHRRLAALDDALPSDAERSRVVAVLERRGLTVTDESSWTITATGDSTTVTDLFGTRPSLPRNASAKRFRAATGELPDQPSGLDGLVSGVYPATGGPRVFQPEAAALRGADVRAADTPAGVPPSTGQHDAGLTIATLQFADFDPADLTRYASINGLADPVAAGRYRPVEVGDPGTLDGNDEVALDQESILSTAPSAVQQPYFAPNTDSGYIEALAAVYDDVTADASATRPNRHIAALSISWGLCEALTGPSFIAAAEPVLKSLVGAGVTVFASTGDTGIYDCGSVTGTGLDDAQADVDYPASSPYVVATGGTLLTGNGAPNSGANWSESAWSCTGPASCQNPKTGTGGSGGGVSGSAYGKVIVGDDGVSTGAFSGFAEPDYQRHAITTGAYASVAKRMLPDIAADGDPSSGLDVVYTDYSGRRPRRVTARIGGTSLAAPLSAAQLVNTLGDAGVTGGVGDIHQALYAAYTATEDLPDTSPDKAFRDVTAGSNGAAVDRGADPSVSAAAGYDTVSGLGGVLWPALTPYLLGSGTPTVTVRLTPVRQASTRRHGAVRVHWTSVRGTDSLKVASTTVVVRAGGKQVFRSTQGRGTRKLLVRPGARVVAVVTATDVAGRHASSTARRPAPRVRRRAPRVRR